MDVIALLAATPLIALLQLSIRRCLPVTLAITAAGFFSAGFLFASRIGLPAEVFSFFIIDSLGCCYAALVMSSAAAVCLISYSYVKRLPRPDEYYVLVGLAALGAVVIIFARHYAALFLGLEVVSVSSCALIAYRKSSFPGAEGAIKYLVLAGVGSAFLLFGIGMLYLQTGTLTLGPIPSSPLTLAAAAMMVVGIGFKLGVVPFYLWTPDVYQGAPAPVAALIATVSKGSVFAFFLKFFLVTGQPSASVVMGLAIASMVVGNLALLQDNIKRLLGYSSIAHMGYLLVALMATGPYAQGAVAFYLTAYCITIIGAFCVITLLSANGEECEQLASFRGLAGRHPVLASVFALMLFSLAGLPLTAGFMGKAYIFRAALSSSFWVPVGVLIVTSVIGLFYYLRVISALFAREESVVRAAPSASGSGTLAVLTFLLLWLGVCPNGLLELISSSALP